MGRQLKHFSALKTLVDVLVRNEARVPFCSVVDFWTRSFGRCTRFPNRNPPIDPLNTEVALLPLVVLLLVQGVAAGDGGALILLSHSRINGAAREGSRTRGVEEHWPGPGTSYRSRFGFGFVFVVKFCI